MNFIHTLTHIVLTKYKYFNFDFVSPGLDLINPKQFIGKGDIQVVT